MLTDVGEYIVGAYLQMIKKCDFVDYNVRFPGGGLRGLNELDVVGLDFKSSTSYLCEVTTHIRGVNRKNAIVRMKKKHEHQIEYAKRYLKNFDNHVFMYWSPVVPRGYLTEELSKIENLELIINGLYKKSIEELMDLAKIQTHDARNPFFRILQILQHLRD